MTADGRLIVNHWPRPMVHDGFDDPHRRPIEHVRVQHLGWGTIQDLRTPDGHRIWLATSHLAICEIYDVTPCYEVKPDVRLTEEKYWRPLAQRVRELDHPAVIMAQP